MSMGVYILRKKVHTHTIYLSIYIDKYVERRKKNWNDMILKPKFHSKPFTKIYATNHLKDLM